MRILGIETSCDETSAAVIETTTLDRPVTLLSTVVASSMTLHSQTGGIIPEVAAREQIKYILPIIDEAISLSSRAKSRDPHTNIDIDAIAVTIGPGLIGSLLVGVETAKTLSMTWHKPLIPVNHLFGHMYANWITNKQLPQFPILSLIVSGGHTDLVLMRNHGDITWLAGTRDDAAGEAFDKIGRLLHLSYPAGPEIEQLAKTGNPKRFSFPRPLLHEPTLDFSFSGLKTAVLRETQKLKENLDHQTICDIARATQDAIIDVLVKKTLKAAEHYQVKSIIISGGVAANETLTQALQHAISTNYALQTTTFFVPSKQLCTDNGAMIATAGFYNYTEVSWRDISANPELYFD
jgi:N6-L-threonylcarbamoyladenine synthase